MEGNKARRRPNFFDVLFVLLILVVIGAAWFLSHRDSAAAPAKTRTYMFELLDLPADMLDAVQPGDKITDNVKNLDMGVVTGVEILPSTASVLDEASGIIRQAPRPDRYVLQITATADTTETQTSIETVSGYTLRVGSGVSCTIGNLTSGGYILSVER